MNFEELLVSAKNGNKDSQAEILRMYHPLIVKNSMVNGFYDADLFQELSATVLVCIKNFKI